MARSRMRAAARKRINREAQTIGSGVYTVAVDLIGRRDLPLPVYVTAPLIYVCEMVAAAVCKERGWTDREQHDDVARYLMAGLQEFTVGLVEGFDVEHFQAWSAAARGERVDLPAAAPDSSG